MPQIFAQDSPATLLLLLTWLVAIGAEACSDGTSPRAVTLRLEASALQVEPGDTVELEARVIFNHGESQTLDPRALQWSVSDPGVATVSRREGILATWRPGTVTVRARDGNLDLEGSVEVQVTTPTPHQIRLSRSLLRLIRTETATLAARVLDKTGRMVRELPSGQEVTWHSTDSAIATVTAEGVVRARAPGSTRVVVRLGDLRDEAEIDVREFPPLVLEPDPLVLTDLGDSARIAAHAEGEPREDVTYTVLRQNRWLDERPVLNLPALERGVVRALAPGTARVEARAPLTLPDTLAVRIVPARPLVMEQESWERVPDGTRVRLRGYRLADLAAGEIRADGDLARALEADSANLHLFVPQMEQEGCHGSGTSSLSASAGDVAPRVRIPRRREGELDLAPGEILPVQDPETTCLKLPPLAGSRYELAFVDSRGIEQARSEPILRGDDFPSYRVSVLNRTLDGAETTPAIVRKTASALEPSELRALSSRLEGPLEEPDAPWSVGDVFRVRLNYDTLEVRVLQTFGENLAVAASTEEDGFPPETVREEIEVAGEWLTRTGLPFLDSLLPGGPPRFANGQLLVVLLPGSAGGIVGRGLLNWTAIRIDSDPPQAALTAVLYHELGHVYHHEYRAQLLAEGVAPGHQAQWAGEGMAELLSNELLRQQLELPFDADLDWLASNPPALLGELLLEARVARGDVTLGYTHGASFLRDLTFRLMEEGRFSYRQAMIRIFRSTQNGWYGCRYDGSCEAVGVAEEMERSLGRPWDPVQGLLLWTLSQAADDETSNPELRNLTFEAVGRLSNEEAQGAQGWPREALLDVGSGEGVSVEQVIWSPSYVTVSDPEGWGASLALDAEVPGVAWMLLRVK